MRKSAPVLVLFVSIISLFGFIHLGPAIGAESTEKEAEPLILNQGTLVFDESQERTLEPGTIHAWTVPVEPGHFAEVEVEPEGFDALLRLLDPESKSETELNLASAGYTERASWIAEVDGAWTLHVLLAKDTQAGSYEIRWSTAQEAQDQDEGTVEGQRLFHRARALHLNRDYEAAEPLYLRALTLRESSLAPEHPAMLRSLNNLANLYSEQVRYAEAEPIYQRVLAIREESLGPDHPDVADSLTILANLYKDQGRYDEAEPLYQRSLAILEKALGPKHPRVADGLNNLAILYWRQGRYDEAEPLYQRSLAIREKSLGQEHPEVAGSLNNLAVLYLNQARYDEVEPLQQRSLAIREKALGTDHPHVAMSLNNLAILYSIQGRYDEVEPLHQRSLAIKEKALGPEHPDVADSLINLAVLYFLQGRYDEAEPLYQRSLAILEKALGPEHPRVADSLLNLANLYVEQGRYDEAEPLHQRSLAIKEKALGPEHPSVAGRLNNLAKLYRIQARYDEAERLHQRSLAIWEKALGPEHPDVALSLNTLGGLYRIQGRYDETEPLYQRSLAIFEKSLGPEHPRVAECLLNQARLFMDRGADPLDPALTLVDRAIAILDGTTGYPWRRVEAYALRSRILKRMDDFEGALLDLTEALDFIEALRPQTGGGEETRAGFLEKYSQEYDRMVTWQIEAADPALALEFSERRRARGLLDQLAAGRIDLRQSIPEDVRAPLENRETEAKAKLAEYQQRITLLRSREDLSEEDKLKRLSDLEASLLEASENYGKVYEEIKNASPLWRDLLTSGGQPVSLAALRRMVLPRNGWMLLYQIGKEQSHLFVVGSASRVPEVYALEVSEKLGKELMLEPGPLTSDALQNLLFGADEEVGLFQSLSSSVRGVRMEQPESASTAPVPLHALWRLLVPEGLWEKIQESTEVLIVPDGALHFLPFESLMVMEGETSQKTQYWLDDGPAIRYGPSATTLYNVTQRPSSRSNRLADQASVLSLSDPMYDTGEVERALRAATEGFPETPPVEKEDSKPASQSRYVRSGGSLIRLPGTAKETEVIRKTFDPRQDGSRVVTLTGLEATERKLRNSLAHKPYVHLATHGLVDETRGSMFAALALTPNVEDEAVTEDDGFFQLYEIYDTKLPDCELAVLSACQTNIGTQVEGEGVFALSRGFLVAGARRVVASQWNVDDESTAALMGAFFEQIAEAERAGRSVDYSTALRDAKKKIRSNEKWADPFYWAPFILMGKR